MTAFEQSVWLAVFAGEFVRRNMGIDGFYPVDPAVKAADHAVADLARYRREHGQVAGLGAAAAEYTPNPIGQMDAGQVNAQQQHVQQGKARR